MKLNWAGKWLWLCIPVCSTSQGSNWFTTATWHSPFDCIIIIPHEYIYSVKSEAELGREMTVAVYTIVFNKRRQWLIHNSHMTFPVWLYNYYTSRVHVFSQKWSWTGQGNDCGCVYHCVQQAKAVTDSQQPRGIPRVTVYILHLTSAPCIGAGSDHRTPVIDPPIASIPTDGKHGYSA